MIVEAQYSLRKTIVVVRKGIKRRGHGENGIVVGACTCSNHDVEDEKMKWWLADEAMLASQMGKLPRI